MSAVSNTNTRIARNTAFLYIRKILGLCISLYTSRILLQTLGIDDFGLYGLIGSIVLLFSSLRSLFASSVQRFLNTEKEGSIEHQNAIFSLGVSIHVGISALFFVIVEGAGLIMIPHLNLLPEKVSVAVWLLQFSILSAILSILTVPYDALMMAKERFDALALFSLLDSFLRLSVVYLLVLSPFNRVVFYSILLFIVAFIIRFLSAMYCKRKFSEIARFRFVHDRRLFKEMTMFAGWNFFGNLGYSLTNQGLNFVLNLFGGVVANAARTIAYQVNDNMRSFVVDISMAFTPQSMMSYHNDKNRFYNLQFFSAKASSAIFLVFVFPIYLMTKPILEFWLGENPTYAVSFIHGIIFYSIVRNIHGPVDIAFKSANRMKTYQILEISILILNLPISWIALHFGIPLYSVFSIMAVVDFLNLCAILVLARNQIGFPIGDFISRVMIRIVVALALLAFGYTLFELACVDVKGIFSLLLYCALLAVVAALVGLFVIFDASERIRIFELFIKKIRK